MSVFTNRSAGTPRKLETSSIDRWSGVATSAIARGSSAAGGASFRVSAFSTFAA